MDPPDIFRKSVSRSEHANQSRCARLGLASENSTPSGAKDAASCDPTTPSSRTLELANAKTIDEALSRLGDPISEAAARRVASLEDCECKDGMFALAATRRQIFAGTGLAAAVGHRRRAPGCRKVTGRRRRILRPGGFDQGAGPHHRRGRRLRHAIAIRDRGALGEPDKNGRVFSAAEQFWDHHAVGSPLRASSRRHPQHRPCATQPRHSRAGRPTDEIFARRHQALPDDYRAPISWSAPAPPAARS